MELYLNYKIWENMDWETCRQEDLTRGQIQSLKSLTPQEESAKEMVEKICKRNNVQLITYDLSTRTGKLKATAKGVKGSSIIVVNQDPGKQRIMNITSYMTEDELNDLISGQMRQPHADARKIGKLKLDGSTPNDLPDFACVNCGGHRFMIYPDYSGKCAKCGKPYLNIKTVRSDVDGPNKD